MTENKRTTNGPQETVPTLGTGTKGTPIMISNDQQSNTANTTTDVSARWDTEPLNMSAYLERIDHRGPLTPRLETLRALQHAHLEAIPFEAINPYLGVEVPLDIESLQEKMVDNRRGGYCHEQNILFGTVLARLGFHVTGRNARMLMGADEQVITGRGHAILSVIVDGIDHHVDVGIGNVGPRGPIPLTEGTTVTTGAWRYRMDRSDLGMWVLRYQRPREGDWFAVVQFDESTHYRSDYSDHNFIAATHPSSPFTQRPIVSYNGADKRLALTGLTLNTYLPDGGVESQELTPDVVPKVLRTEFGVHLTRNQESDLVERLRT